MLEEGKRAVLRKILAILGLQTTDQVGASVCYLIFIAASATVIATPETLYISFWVLVDISISSIELSSQRCCPVCSKISPHGNLSQSWSRNEEKQVWEIEKQVESVAHSTDSFLLSYSDPYQTLFPNVFLLWNCSLHSSTSLLFHQNFGCLRYSSVIRYLVKHFRTEIMIANSGIKNANNSNRIYQ